MSDIAHTGSNAVGEPYAMDKERRRLEEIAAYVRHRNDIDPTTASIDALRDAITSRDRHFDALGEQLRQGFEETKERQDDDREAVSGWISMAQQANERALAKIVEQFGAFEAGLKVLGAQLEQIKVKQESTNFITASINNILARRFPAEQPANKQKRLICVKCRHVIRTGEAFMEGESGWFHSLGCERYRQPAGRKKAKRAKIS